MNSDSGRERLFGDWLSKYRRIIFKVVKSYARSPADADELQQEIQLQLWKSVAAFSGNAKESTWIYKVSLNAALAWRRGSDRRQDRIETHADFSGLASNAKSPSESASQRDLLDGLYAAVHALEPFDRALVLLMLDGLAYREIAEVMGLTETHVSVLLSRSRKRLAKLMKGLTNELE